MTTKKRSASNKARKKTIKKASKKAIKKATTTRAAEVFTAEDLVHSPIIITDGSLSVEFDGRFYMQTVIGHHMSLGLRLDNVEVTQGGGGHRCREFNGTDIHRISVQAMIGNVPTEIVIVGAKVPSLGSFSPALDFARETHFIEDPGTFPPGGRFGRRFGNRDARITRFTITNIRTGEVHDCPFATRPGFRYIINDGHVV